MKKALVIGAAGGLGSKFVLGLIERSVSVTAVSRTVLNEEVMRKIYAAEAKSQYRLVKNYLEITPDQDYNYVFFCSGIFQHKKIVDITESEINQEFEANIVQPTILTKRFLVDQKNVSGQAKDFIYVGSTTAYQGFSDMSTYCASKFALRGFVQSLNDEYKNTGNRFWLVSMGTMYTRMGVKHAKSIGRDPGTLIDPSSIASRVLTSLFEGGDTYEPEIIFRYRKSQLNQ